MALPTIHQIYDDFDVLTDWEDRYKYIIDLGRSLPPSSATLHHESHKISGCASQAWLVAKIRARSDDPVLDFEGDSDALIVKGLMAIVLAIYSGQTAKTILATDAQTMFKQLDLTQHLSAQRANGVAAMINRIKGAARVALEA